jgi:hypothetical protein
MVILTSNREGKMSDGISHTVLSEEEEAPRNPELEIVVAYLEGAIKGGKDLKGDYYEGYKAAIQNVYAFVNKMKQGMI